MAAKPTSPPPAYFLSLSLENVRSFGAKQTISFARADGRPAQWTIILGDNGVGKTTVLKSLAALMPVKLSDYKDDSMVFAKNVDYNDVYLAAYQADLKLKTAWPIFRHDIKTRAALKSSIELKESLNSNVTEQVIIVLKFEASGFSTKSSKVGDLPKNLIIYGYGAGRTVGSSTLSDNSESYYTYTSLFDDRADLLNPEEWFLNIDYGSKLAGAANTQLADARDRVEKMLIDVLPGVTNIQIAAAGTPQKPQISLQFLLYDTWVRLRDMSLGYQTLVVWLTDLASKLYVRYPESKNPLAEPAIVLIDEIDLHLHPKWQRELLGVLSSIFPETQFIATAHSPLVVQAAGDVEANVVLLRREGDQTVVVPDLPDIERWRIDQILNSELFDNVPAHSVATEQQLRRRDALLAKARLSAKDKEELNELNRFVHSQPVGESSTERRAADVLRELARKLGKQDLLD